jgi:hypothetical protein
MSPIAARVGRVKEPVGRTRVEPEALPAKVTAPVCTVKAVVKVAEFVNVKVELPLIVAVPPRVSEVPAPLIVFEAPVTVKVLDVVPPAIVNPSEALANVKSFTVDGVIAPKVNDKAPLLFVALTPLPVVTEPTKVEVAVGNVIVTAPP